MTAKLSVGERARWQAAQVLGWTVVAGTKRGFWSVSDGRRVRASGCNGHVAAIRRALAAIEGDNARRRDVVEGPATAEGR